MIIDSFACVQGSVSRRRPSRGVSGRRPGPKGEVSQTEGPGPLPLSGQEQRRNPDAPVQTYSSRCVFLFVLRHTANRIKSVLNSQDYTTDIKVKTFPILNLESTSLA